MKAPGTANAALSNNNTAKNPRNARNPAMVYPFLYCYNKDYNINYSDCTSKSVSSSDPLSLLHGWHAAPMLETTYLSSGCRTFDFLCSKLIVCRLTKRSQLGAILK